MMDIRRATLDDIGNLYDIYAQIGVKDDGYFERCLEEQDKGNREIYIAIVEGADIGFCILNWRPRYDFYRKLDIPEIQDLNIVPSHRKQGYATQLIEFCEDLAKEKGCAHIGVSVGVSHNYGPAQRLYAKLGYHPDGNGVTYDRTVVIHGMNRAVDDDLCLMLVKAC